MIPGDPPRNPALDVPATRLPFPAFGGSALLVLLVLIISNVVVGGMIVTGLIIKMAQGSPLDPSLVLDLIPAAILGIVGNSLGFGLVIVFGYLRSKQPASRVFPLRPVPFRFWLPLLACLVGGLILASEIETLLVQFLPPPDWVKEAFAQILGKGTGVPAFILLVIVAPITEELLFRGVILNGLLAHYGKIRAILLSAAFFGAIHILPWQVLPAFCLGLLFAWWTIETGSLWPALIAHALTNGFAFFMQQSQESSEAFQVEHLPLWLLGLGVLLLAGGISWSLSVYRKASNRPAPLTNVPA